MEAAIKTLIFIVIASLLLAINNTSAASSLSPKDDNKDFLMSLLNSTASANGEPNLTYFRGEWGPAEYCNKGHRARGFALKVEPPRGRKDDTALNAIALECTDGAVITSYVGAWGSWTGYQYCYEGEFISSYQLRVEAPQGHGDDTGANNLNVMCTNGQYLYGQGLSWGTWSVWHPACCKGICGLRTRVEAPRGKRKDDTALNDVEMICCT